MALRTRLLMFDICCMTNRANVCNVANDDVIASGVLYYKVSYLPLTPRWYLIDSFRQTSHFCDLITCKIIVTPLMSANAFSPFFVVC